MRREFFVISGCILVLTAVLGYLHPWTLWSLGLTAPVIGLGLIDSMQTRHAIRRNFPVIGNLRYFFEFIRPELQQYFVESNLSGRPIPRELRSVIYQRAKGDTQTTPFGTQLDVNAEHYEWVNHSIAPRSGNAHDVRIAVGGRACTQPYLASVMNISAMSYGALSSAAVSALNLGAKLGGFYHNTGEGGVSPYHLLGGDVTWQIGTGYFGCRTPEGTFSESAFTERATLPNVKMIEIKLSQGAKPGKGGILPASKVNEEVSKIRLVPMGKDVVSPAGHSAFKTPRELLTFIARLRTLSGGKPVGIKLCLGARHEFLAVCKAMIETGERPDFITVDGGEGGTGAAPLEFTNYVGTPLIEGLAFVVDALRGFGLRRDVRVIASGKMFTSFDLLRAAALGADMVSSARGMMLAMGCIQALKCHTNECPTGVATSNPDLMKGLYVPSKLKRVARFQKETVYHFVELLGALGLEKPSDLRRADVNRRGANGVVKTLEDLFPTMAEGCLLDGEASTHLSPAWQTALKEASPESFRALRAEPAPLLQRDA